MATKKAGTAAKKKTTTKSTPAAAKPSTTTKVTTVKAVAAEPTATKPRRRINRSFIASSLIAEFIGVFLLTTVYMGTKGDPFYMGFALAGIVLIIGTLSGAHVNPAVTIGAWVTRKISTPRALGYIAAQVLGAALAFSALSVFLGAAPAPTTEAAQMGQAGPQLFKVAALTNANHWFVFFVELIAATIFTFGVASARREVTERTAKALTIGFSLTLAGVFGIIAAGYSQANAVFNPAIAVAVQAVDWKHIDAMSIAAYLIAPLLGGVLGFGLRDILSAGEAKSE